MDLKEYTLIAGKHHMDGKTYRPGDKIKLTAEQAKGLVNKIADPNGSFGVTVDQSSANVASLEAENAKLRERIAQLETENTQLREAIDEQDDEE